MSTISGDERFYMDTEEDGYTEKEAGWAFLRMSGQDDDEDEDSAGENSDF